MTNREWINSLPDKELVSWMFYDMPKIGRMWTSSTLGVENWLKEEHTEQQSEQQNIRQYIDKI